MGGYEASLYVHIKPPICLDSFCDECFPAGGYTDIGLDKDGLPAFADNPFMRRSSFALSNWLKISAYKHCTLNEKLMADLSTNSLG